MKFDSGCLPVKPDKRDKKFTQIAFGGATLPVFPKTLNRTYKKVKNQGNSLSCTAQTCTLASEYQENRELSAAWHWAQTCKKIGSYVPNGADPRTAMKISLDLGDLPAELAHLSFPGDPSEIGNWSNWGYVLPEAVEYFKKATYIRIPRVGDYFDSICAALVNGFEKNQVVMSFMPWHSEWTGADITDNYEKEIVEGYHATTFPNFDTTYKDRYVIIQNSYGEGFGDKGFQTIGRDTINREFSRWGTGCYVFHDLTPEQIARAKELGLFGDIQRTIINAWRKFMDL